MPVKITHNSISQSNEQVICAEAGDSELSTSNLATSRIATVQLYLLSQISVLNSDLVFLFERRKRGMLTQKHDVELKEKKKKDELENKLKKKSSQKSGVFLGGS